MRNLLSRVPLECGENPRTVFRGDSTLRLPEPTDLPQTESLDLLAQLAEFGIYGESSAAVGARFVDQALKEFVQRNIETPTTIQERSAMMDHDMTYEELIALQLPRIDFHEGIVNLTSEETDHQLRQEEPTSCHLVN